MSTQSPCALQALLSIFRDVAHRCSSLARGSSWSALARSPCGAAQTRMGRRRRARQRGCHDACRRLQSCDRRPALDGCLVCEIGMADVLDAQAVLIAPELGQRAREPAPRRASPAPPPSPSGRGGLPVLGPAMFSHAVVETAGNVAGGEDMRDWRAACTVGEDPVRRQAASLQPVRSRGRPRCRPRPRRRPASAPAQAKLLDHAVAPCSLELRREPHVDALVGVHRHQPAADVLAEHRTERSWQRLDDRHVSRRGVRWKRPPGR